MRNLDISERKILEIVFNSSSLKLGTFTVLKKLKIDMPSFIKNLSNLEKYGYIKYTTTEVYLLDEGKKYILLSKSRAVSSERSWENVPEKFIGKQLDADEMYIPSKKILSKKTFKKVQG
ncbi:hypothetical protein [Leclercia adecarboxylata]|jgi:hypothetical protein|uniref:hypothetical protein n=1 Tax=Leclercia adecarboxylata TaxID=83655 RepID=UPI0013C9FE75|nr:hypothetical protein [Leclercia adecarboxylata]NEG93023.1 hypothetical protein [Leclercia adecarboxylata]